MTNQEIYNKVRDHLLAQNCRAEAPFGCAYRGRAGTKCAIGVLITDENYSPQMEASQFDTLPRKFQQAVFQSVNRTFGDDVNTAGDKHLYWLLVDLQRVHDETPVATWRAELTRVANHFGLVP